MNDLDRLLLERELALVLRRYASMCDERDWAAIGEVYSADARADYGGWKLRDRAAILAMLKQHLDGCGATQHLLGNLKVTVEADIVSSRIAVRAAHRGTGPRSGQTYECMGEYRDRWTPTAEGWRISQREMVVVLEFGSRDVLAGADGLG